MNLVDLTLLAAGASAPFIARRAWKRATPGTRRDLRRVYLDAKVRSGRYALSDLLDLLAQAAIDRCLRVNGRPMLPSDLSFGLHPDDYANMRGLVPQLEDELVEVLGDWLVAERGRTDGPLTVTIHCDDAARHGRPVLTARAPGAQRRTHGPVRGRRRPVTEHAAKPIRPHAAREAAPASSTERPELRPTEWLPDDLRPTEWVDR